MMPNPNHQYQASPHNDGQQRIDQPQTSPSAPGTSNSQSGPPGATSPPIQHPQPPVTRQRSINLTRLILLLLAVAIGLAILLMIIPVAVQIIKEFANLIEWAASFRPRHFFREEETRLGAFAMTLITLVVIVKMLLRRMN